MKWSIVSCRYIGEWARDWFFDGLILLARELSVRASGIPSASGRGKKNSKSNFLILNEKKEKSPPIYRSVARGCANEKPSHGWKIEAHEDQLKKTKTRSKAESEFLISYLRSHNLCAMKKEKQLLLLKKHKLAYGGELLKTRAGRSSGRPLDTKSSMHLVMRSSQAVGPLSFWAGNNKHKIQMIVAKFSRKYGVKIISLANVGNHLHFHIKLGNRHAYRPFIRAISSAIAMAVAGKSRWNKVSGKFWDYRPFTRVVVGYHAFLKMVDYIRINQLEGYTDRVTAELIVKGDPEIEALLSG